VEGLARLVLDPPRYHDQPLQFDAALGFRGVPGFRQESQDADGRFVFALNSEGLRGAEIPREPVSSSAPSTRVALVGDSFLVARALREERAVTSLVAAGLAERGAPADVYNFSVTDYGTGQQLLLLRELAQRLRPDAVVLFLYPANDLVNDSLGLAGRTTVSAGDYVRPYVSVGEDGDLALRYAHPLLAQLRRASRLFGVLETRLLSLGRRRNVSWLQPWSPPADVVQSLRAGGAPREDLEVFRRHAARDPWEQAWRQSFALLRAFRDACRGLGARLLVVVVPSAHQVERGAKVLSLDAATRLVTGRPLDRLLDWNLPESRLAPFLAGERIDAHLLLGPLRRATRGGASVYGRDEHWTPSGHEVAAAGVLDWLTQGRTRLEWPISESEPVAVLPAASGAAAPLDFSEQPHQVQLGDGWLRWTPRGRGEDWGWRPGGRALVVVPHGAGDLVLRGWIPPGAALPYPIRLEIVGRPPRGFRIDRAGPFEIRLPPGGGLPPAARVDGYVAVVVGSGGAPRGPGVAQRARVRSVGFEEAAGR
jgi:hypothetical protein